MLICCSLFLVSADMAGTHTLLLGCGVHMQPFSAAASPIRDNRRHTVQSCTERGIVKGETSSNSY